jgi:hypothetical protein
MMRMMDRDLIVDGPGVTTAMLHPPNILEAGSQVRKQEHMSSE